MPATDDKISAEEFSLIRECAAGRTDTYNILVERYKTMAYNIAYRMLGDADLANDMAQESFIAAYHGLKDFHFDSKFSSWLYRIVLNKCKDHLRTRKETVPVEDIADLLPASEANPEQMAASRQTGDAVQAALNMLPKQYREVIILKHLEELGYEEIAVILGEHVSTLKVRAHRGREMMKDLLANRGVTS
jgi:RNA polymerase sigma-70 factor (ECF subfamily)